MRGSMLDRLNAGEGQAYYWRKASPLLEKDWLGIWERQVLCWKRQAY
jgi:hypothetical protein